MYHKQKQGNCTADIRQLYPACHIGWSHRFHVGLPYGQNFPEYRLADRIADPDKISRMHYNAEIRDQGGILPQHYIQRAWVAFQTFVLSVHGGSRHDNVALAGNGAVPRKVLVIAIVGLVYTALFSSVLGYKCTVNE